MYQAVSALEQNHSVGLDISRSESVTFQSFPAFPDKRSPRLYTVWRTNYVMTSSQGIYVQSTKR